MGHSLLIVGTGGQGKMALECALSSQSYSHITFVTNDPNRPKTLAGFEVLGEDSFDVRDVASCFDGVFVAIGDNRWRRRIQEQYAEAGAHIVTLVHKSASISRFAQLGIGTIVMPQAAVNAFARVGNGCIVNTGAIVEHDCVVEDWCHISPGAKIGGWSAIGESSWLCLGSVVSDHLSVCSGVTLAANSVLLSDVADAGLYAGAPAILKKPADICI